MNKKIGIITSTYNNQAQIMYAIQSVKAQTYDNYVHYIYDDDSLDDTKNLIFSIMPDNKIFYFQGDNNRGQSFGRNFLIKKAIEDGCDYIAFLDADDFWFKHHLEKNIKQLNDADIVYSTPEFIQDIGYPAFMLNVPIPKIFIGKQLKHNNFIWISSVVAKKECFLNNYFDSSLDSIEDWDMWLRLNEQNYKFAKQPETTIIYTVNKNSQAAEGKNKKSLLEKKHQLINNLKLHLACGLDYQHDYINVDLYPLPQGKYDAHFDVSTLPYEDNSVDEIRAFHIIEHFDFFESQHVLNEWYRVLKPGGRLWIETPDFLATCDAFVKGDEDFRILLYGQFFAHPWVPGQTHKFLFTESQLVAHLSWSKFKSFKRLPPASNYVMDSTVDLFLNAEVFK